MPKLSLIFRTDVHALDKSPFSWKGDYPAEIWTSLEQIGELARETGATAILDGGDYFHLKAASRNPHALVSKTAEIHRAYPCPVYAIEGNHDIAYNSLDTLHRQPLGVLFASEVFHRLRDVTFENEGVKVRVVGLPYSPFRTLDDLRAIRKNPGDQYLVVVLHALAGESPPDKVEEFFREPVFRYRDLVAFDGPDVICFGHWHKDQGIVEIEGKQFVNQGAVSRGALTKENTERTPQVALIEATPEAICVRTIKLKVAPSEEVFDLDRKRKKDAEDKNIDQFIEVLQANLSVDPAKNLESNIESLGFAADVRDMALEYLERARSESARSKPETT